MVPEPDRAVGAPAGAYRSPFAGTMAREWHRAELRRVRQSLRLQKGSAHVSGELLPGVVSQWSVVVDLCHPTAVQRYKRASFKCGSFRARKFGRAPEEPDPATMEFP